MSQLSRREQNTKQEQSLNEADLQHTYPLSASEHTCFNCGRPQSASADICENCGKWQLVGQCCFCYSTVEPGQLFCSECGCPPFGITCPTCQTHSIFDFCPSCNTLITEKGDQTITELRHSAEFEAIRELVAKFPISPNDSTELTIDKDVDDLQMFLQHLVYKPVENITEQSHLVSKPTFELRTDPNSADRLKNLGSAIQQATIAKQRQDQSRLLQLQVIQQLMAFQQKTFEDNQSARRYYGALKALTPELSHNDWSQIQLLVPQPVGWRCHAFNVIHPEGPNKCARPQDGGEWIYENRT